MSIKHETGGVLSANRDWFYFSSYFNMWSRVLIRAGRTQGFLQEITIPLTPYKGWHDQPSVEKIKECIINVFDPCPSVYDSYTHLLPGGVYEMMTDAYGIELRNFLLDKDILRFIDLKVLLDPNVNKGGVPYELCSNQYPHKQGLIERLKDYPELYDMPYALEKHMESKKGNKRT